MMDEQEFIAVKSAIVNRAVAQALRETRRRRQWMAEQAKTAEEFRAAVRAQDGVRSRLFEAVPGTKIVRVKGR